MKKKSKGKECKGQVCSQAEGKARFKRRNTQEKGTLSPKNSCQSA